MTSRPIHLILAAALALGGGAAFTGCGEDDRPERQDIERGVDDATDEAGEAAEGAGDALEGAGEATEDALTDGE